MIKHQFIERATEVTWMLLLISFWLFVDLWLRTFHDISVLDISNTWLKNDFDVSDGIGIIVSYSFVMAGVIPGVRFVLPFLLRLAYISLSTLFNWKFKNEGDKYFMDYYIEEEEIKYQAIEANNSVLWNTYSEHVQVKSSVIKQQTVCQSIVLFAAIGYILPETTIYIFQFVFELLGQQIWYIDYPLSLILGGFLMFVAGISVNDLKHINYMPKKVSKVAEKYNKKSNPTP